MWNGRNICSYSKFRIGLKYLGLSASPQSWKILILMTVYQFLQIKFIMQMTNLLKVMAHVLETVLGMLPHKTLEHSGYTSV